MDGSAKLLACPLCYNQFPHHVREPEVRTTATFGYGLDYRLFPRDCNLALEVATCPDCLFTYRIRDFHGRIPGQVKDVVRSKPYVDIFSAYPEEDHPARSWMALIAILQAKGLNPRDLGILSLKGSWVARELGSLRTEDQLLESADKFFEDALRRGLTKGDPALIMYLIGEINRRRKQFLRGRQMVRFLGNNMRYRYATLLQVVLMEEEDSTPYWTFHAPDKMEQHTSSYNGVFPPLRSIPPRKRDFHPEELTEGLREEPNLADDTQCRAHQPLNSPDA